jgi:hypothetical protein
MDASKKSCPIKTTLLVAWQNAANNYSKAVSELSHKIGMLSKSEYERLKQEAEQARQRSIDAQATLTRTSRSMGAMATRKPWHN